jgi:hypothetical protein
MKVRTGILILLMAPVMMLPVFAGIRPVSSAASGEEAAQKTSAEPAADGIEYSNTKYGFSFSLPEGWKGYTIVIDRWEGNDREKGAVDHGPVVRIRHPEWTKESPRQDIPIMVFTLAQWDSIEQGNFVFSAAPVRPLELGRNKKYVFALSPSFDNGDVAGGKEVNQILRHGPLHPLWST